VKRPSTGALLLGAIPFLGICFSVSWWDRAEPGVLGMPFNFCWLLGWILLTPFILGLAYWLEKRR
jgi:hypothetical protein